MAGQKSERSYHVYPTNPEERKQAFTVFQFARENKIQQPQYIDDNGTVWRWDNKGNGKFALIQTNKKLARNARDRARRLETSLSAEDFEEAFPGKGAELYAAEVARIEEIYANATEDEDVDHIYSLGSGGLNVSQNLRPLDAAQNRAEGDRGRPSELEMSAFMLADTKADQVRLQGPRFPPRATVKLDQGLGMIRLVSDRLNTVQNMVDVFQQGQTGSELNQAVQAVDESGLLEANVGGVTIGRNDPKTDLGRKAFSILFEPNRDNPITEETLDFNL